MPLDGKVAVITGGTRGIGRAVALAMARVGARVCVVGRHEPAAAETVAEIERGGGKGLAVLADVAGKAEVERAFAEARSAWGPVEILVAAAGIWSLRPILELTEAAWDEMMAVHVKGTLFCMQAAIPDMLAVGRGKIITVSSPAAVVGSNVKALHYAAAKGAIIAMTRSAAKELAPHRITVNCVSPAARTEMFERLTAVFPDEVARAAYFKRFPLGVPAAADIAGVFLFLASPASDYLTGQVLNADGGMVMS